ncbi:MAG: hypothetical protein FWD17_15215 [Polyangiaceae bacterium]|nr:hypothetical protein [Polyangiaceae bacterium]
MRSFPICIFALALVACSSESTGQSPAAAVAAAAAVPAAGGTSDGNSDAGRGGGRGNAGGNAGGGGLGGPVEGGCTYTQGFWKNHPSAWPVTSLAIGGVTYSQQQLLDLFNTSPGGDASLILAHQLIAALLNVANGAAPSASVQQAIDDAQAWMTANQGSAAGLPYGVAAGSAAGQQATALTDTLDSFNSGGAGTPHCGDGNGGGSGSSSSESSSSGSSSSNSSDNTIPR